ncbi:MAG: NUDIX domain-containing protein [Candidatus Binataceae bacterium]
MESEFRRAARLVVVDLHNHILLFQYARLTGQKFWATPGGGLEDGETFEEAAAREALEELGVRNPRLHVLCDRTADFVFVDRQVHQTETFFLLRLESLEFDEEIREVHSREGILETRWWSLAELRRSSELIFPEDLAEILRCATRGGESR